MDMAVMDPDHGVGAAAVTDVGRPAFTCVRVDPAWLASRGSDWDRLATEAAGASPFYSRRMVEAHIANGLADDLRCLAVLEGDRLVGLLPHRPMGARIGWFGLANVAWQSPYTTAATPLVARAHVTSALASLLDGMAGLPGPLWLVPNLPLGDAVGTALLAELARRRWPHRVLDAFQRPVFERPADPATAAFDPHREKDLRRRRRRLAELGTIRVASASAGAELSRAVEAFLVLEAAGWKGRQGTALASRAETAAFTRDLFGHLAPGVGARADLLLLDDRPIAISLALICGRTAHMWKAAYDEAFSRYAPGILLEAEIVRHFITEGFADKLDSAAAPGGLLDKLYPDRTPIGDLILLTRAMPNDDALAAIARSELRRRAATGRLKAFYRRVARLLTQP